MLVSFEHNSKAESSILTTLSGKEFSSSKAFCSKAFSLILIKEEGRLTFFKEDMIEKA